ncbi:MAG TPA: cupin domain-containing protein [Candidatus Limnocylindria bacterium]
MRLTSNVHRGRIALVGVAAALALAVMTIADVGPAAADHAPVHGTILARAPFADPTDIRIKALVGGRHQVVHVNHAAETVVQNIVIQPGGFTGWHTHPGPAVAIVALGTLTLYQGSDSTCTGWEYGPGESFVDPGQGNVHGARNEGLTPAVVYVTYFDVPSGAGPAIPASNPGHCDGF